MTATDTSEKKSVLDSVQVRISPSEARYVPLKSAEGFYVGVGTDRVPELHKDIRAFLVQAVKSGCALFATEGGVRVMRGPNGKGGVCFVERKAATTGAQIYLFAPANRERAVKAGLVVTREGNGVYVSPRNKAGEIAFDTLKTEFANNHAPMGFQIHKWPGMEVEIPEVKSAKKKSREVSGKHPVLSDQRRATA